MASQAPPADGGCKSSAIDNEYITELYKKIVMGVKASNEIPSEEDDYHYHLTFGEFNKKVSSTGNAILNFTKQLIYSQSKASKKRNTLVNLGVSMEAFEPIADLVDVVLERADNCLDPQSNRQSSLLKDQLQKQSVVPSRSNHDTISKPQLKFKDKIDNSHAPFVSKYKSLEDEDTCEDLTMDSDSDDSPSLHHPFYNRIVSLKYSDWQRNAKDEDEEIPFPNGIGNTKCSWIATLDDLNDLIANKLSKEDRIAVDLENHSARSYQGFLCLMQISTPLEDFLIDTLRLRSELYRLNKIFTDPTKVKILHGADMDIVWLQRDLGLFIVNMFDTGQAARILEYPGFSLAYLLNLFISYNVDKKYQLADWRVRPLPKEMIKYAREDTRFLIYIYEKMKQELVKRDLLMQVLKQSNQLTLKVYKKPILKENSYLTLSKGYKLDQFSLQEIRVVKALFHWRDAIARELDESTNYVLPNYLLINMAKAMPITSEAIFKRFHPLSSVVRDHSHQVAEVISAAKEEPKNTTSSGGGGGDPKSSHSISSTDKSSFNKKSKSFTFPLNSNTTLSSSIMEQEPFSEWKKQPEPMEIKISSFNLTNGKDLTVKNSISGISLDVKKIVVDQKIETIKKRITAASFVVQSNELVEPLSSTPQVVEEITQSRPEEDVIPLSISETFKLGKKRKTATKAATTKAVCVVGVVEDLHNVKDKDEEKKEEVEMNTFTPFDYESAIAKTSSQPLEFNPFLAMQNSNPTQKKRKGFHRR